MRSSHVGWIRIVVAVAAVGLAGCTDDDARIGAASQPLDTYGDGYSSNLEIPIFVFVYDDANLYGAYPTLVEDTSDLRYQDMNDRISTVYVGPGPSYDSWKARHQGREPTVTF